MNGNSTANAPVCAVTGGSSGIGLATAKGFAAAGYCVAICGRDQAKLRSASIEIAEAAEAAAGGDSTRRTVCTATTYDVSRAGDCEAFIGDAVASFGRLDVLVNNAGAATMAPLEEITRQQFDEMLSVNVAATFHATQAAWGAMKSAGGGVVINIASLAARDPFPGFAVYGACKSWVTLFTKAIATEGRPVNIQAFAVLPGAVETPMLRGALPDFPADQTLAPEDVAETIFALSQPPWKHASGSAIDVVR